MEARWNGGRGGTGASRCICGMGESGGHWAAVTSLLERHTASDRRAARWNAARPPVFPAARAA